MKLAIRRRGIVTFFMAQEAFELQLLVHQTKHFSG